MLKFNRGLQYFLQNATCFRRTGMISNVDELNLINKKLNLGPIDKLIKYKKIPWKGIITCVLVVLIIAQVILFTQRRQRGLINTQNAFAALFMPKGYMTNKLSNTDEGIPTFYFTERDALLQDLNVTIQSYFSFSKDVLDTIVYLPNSDGTKSLPLIELSLFESNRRDVLIKHDVWRSNVISYTDTATKQNPYGTIMGEMIRNDSRAFFDRLQDISISFSVQRMDFSDITPSIVAQCVEWHVRKDYSSLLRGGRIDTVLRLNEGLCSKTRNRLARFYVPSVCIGFIISVLSLISLFLGIKSFIHRINILRKINKNATLQGRQQIISYVTQLPSYVSLWIFIAIFSDICLILSFILMMIDHTNPYSTNFVMGLGAMTQFIGVLRYFRYSTKFYVLVDAVWKAFPNIIRFLISALPIFIGFAICGSLWFAQYATYYGEIIDSIISLYALMNGDQMRVQFNMLYGFNPFLSYLSRIYLFLFSVFFIMAVLNFFLNIMQDAFKAAKRKQESREKIIESSNTLISDYVDDPDDDNFDLVIEDITKHNRKADEIIAGHDGRNLEDVLKFDTSIELLQRIVKIVAEAKHITQENYEIFEEKYRTLKSLIESKDI